MVGTTVRMTLRQGIVRVFKEQIQAWFESVEMLRRVSPKSKGQITPDLTVAWNIFWVWEETVEGDVKQRNNKIT